MGSLQAIDHITQTQLGIADILRSREDVANRIAAVALQDMADRLNGAMAQADRDAAAGFTPTGYPAG